MRETGVLVSGVFAALAGVIGVAWLAMTGLVWHEGQLKPSAGYDESEVGLGVAIMGFFWIVGVVLLLVAVVSSLRQAFKQPAKKRFFLNLAWLVPFVAMLIVVAVWPIILGPGGASFAP